MSYGLISSGRQIKGEAMQGLSDASRRDDQRQMTNDGLAVAKKQGEKMSMASGATTGATLAAGMTTGAAAATAETAAIAGAPMGPMGIAIGAGIGLLAGWALS